MKRFNKWLGNNLANGIGTMFFFYFCVLLDVVELPPVIKSHSLIILVTYLSQTVIQLLALPLLAYQAKIQQGNHKDIMEHFDRIHKHLGIKK